MEQYQIPTMIYEEAQGNALIRTLQYPENIKNKKLPQLQAIISVFFNGINTTLQRTKIAWLTRQIIGALIVCAANEQKQGEGETREHWKRRSKTLKQE